MVSAWLTSPLPRHSSSPRKTGPPQDRASNSRNYILDDLVNGLAEESNHSDNNEDGENIMDEGKAKNYSDGSDDRGDTDDDAGDGNSDSDKGNEAGEVSRATRIANPPSVVNQSQSVLRSTFSSSLTIPLQFHPHTRPTRALRLPAIIVSGLRPHT